MKHRKIRSCLASLESHPRMQDCQSYGSNKDHESFKDHEGDLLISEFAPKSLAQLCHAKTGSNEETEGC